ncbi:MAG: hypothetical protein KFB97_09785 [Cyanobium sp. M30B3]|nr:MAG: hypothetical protein KFB97_09785 [Cyanobium sp. M30B3]
MNFKELVDNVASETELPAGQVRKVGLAILKQFAGLIDSQTNFVSPVLTVTAYTKAVKPEAEGKPGQPERKLARMALRPEKPSASD